MNSTSTSSTSARVPWIALALSFLSAGVGHIYSGRVGKGLILLCAWFLIPVLAVVAAFLTPSPGVLVGLIILPTLGMVVVYVYAAIDAFVQAKRTGEEYTIRDYNRGLVYTLLIAVGLVYPVGLTTVVREFVFEAFHIPTRSMSPNVLRGDRILVNKIVNRHRFPQRGQIVVFREPSRSGRIFVKRVIAVAGDTVEMRGDELLVNGKRLERDRIPWDVPLADTHANGEMAYEHNAGLRYRVMHADTKSLSPEQLEYRSLPATTVPERSFFLLGDNRDLSRDSRKFGTAHIEDIVGYPQYIYWPAERWPRFGVYRDW